MITGIGCVTPIGIGSAKFCEALKAGRSGVGPVRSFDAAPYRCRVGAEVADFRPGDFMALREVRSVPRVAQFAVAATRMALEDAQLRNLSDPSRTGVVLGTSIGPSGYNFEQFGVFLERGVRRIHPSFPGYAHSGVVASECAIQIGARGPVMTISSACTSSADAIGLALLMINTGAADIVLAGGSEAPLVPMLFAAFDRLSLMAAGFNDRPASASRPFSADRDGFVLGEGAAVLVIESEDHARSRGREPIARLAGYGATCDAYSHFAQAEGGEDAVRAIELAIANAGLVPSQVDYVNAHGSATVQNDVFETRIVHQAFGMHAKQLAISSTKSMVGHLMGAGPAVELAATVVAMRDGFVPPTINLDSVDELCDLDYVPNHHRIGVIENAVSISFGFGSRNAAIAVTKAS